MTACRLLTRKIFVLAMCVQIAFYPLPLSQSRADETPPGSRSGGVTPIEFKLAMIFQEFEKDNPHLSRKLDLAILSATASDKNASDQQRIYSLLQLAVHAISKEINFQASPLIKDQTLPIEIRTTAVWVASIKCLKQRKGYQEEENVMFNILRNNDEDGELKCFAVLGLLSSTKNESALSDRLSRILGSNTIHRFDDFIIASMAEAAVFHRCRSLDFLVYTLIHSCELGETSQKHRQNIFFELFRLSTYTEEFSQESKIAVAEFAQRELLSTQNTSETRGSTSSLFSHVFGTTNKALNFALKSYDDPEVDKEVQDCCRHIVENYKNWPLWDGDK